MNEAMLFEQTQLGTFSEIIYGTPPAPTSKGFDFTKLLSLVKAVAGAFPYGTAITAAIDAGEYALFLVVSHSLIVIASRLLAQVVVDGVEGDKSGMTTVIKDIGVQMATAIDGKAQADSTKVKNVRSACWTSAPIAC